MCMHSRLILETSVQTAYLLSFQDDNFWNYLFSGRKKTNKNLVPVTVEL